MTAHAPNQGALAHLDGTQPERAPVAASGALLPACPKCACEDVVATAPDWTDEGITAQVTCDHCEHAWQANWMLALMREVEPTFYEVTSVRHLAGEVSLRVLGDGEVPQSVDAGQLVVLGDVL